VPTLCSADEVDPKNATILRHAAEVYRKQAKTCRELATPAQGDDRAFWLGLSDYWLKLAQVDDEQKALEPTIMPLRRFPSPWKTEEHDTCFIVKDHTGLNLAYVYFEPEPNCRLALKLLSRGEARRIAAKFAKLPQWLDE